jgi:tripartite-type tricarboxylate transporter receptor subunit TctC
MSMRKTMTAARSTAPAQAKIPQRLRLLARALALTAAAFALAPPTHAQAQWPERNVRIIVPLAAGSAVDAAIRIYADRLSQRWGKPVLVENKPGGETTIGIGAFVQGRDDHTLLATVIGSYTTTPQMVDKLPYDTTADLVPIVSMTSIQIGYAVTSSLPARSLGDLVRQAKAEPGKLAWASGPTILRFAPAAHMKQHGLDMPYAVYRDQGQAAIDLGEGRIQLLVSSLQVMLPVIQSGKVRLLAVANATRSPLAPEVLTAREAGFADLTVNGGAALFGWRGIGEALRDRIAADVTAIAGDPDVRKRIEAGGQIAQGGTWRELMAALEAQQQQVVGIARIIDLKAAK